MNLSYRRKLEKAISENRVDQKLLINCCAKFANKASRMAAKMKRNPLSAKYYKEPLQELVEYRAPFLRVLHNEYGMSLDQIKAEIAATLHDEKKVADIPSYEVIGTVREMIVSGEYAVDR